MASSINAITTGSGGVVTTADNSGDLNIQSGGTTVVAVTSAGAAVTGTLSASGESTLTGNVGVGVTPSAWSTYKGIDISTYGGIGSDSATFILTANTYNNGSSWIAKATAASSDYIQSAGAHIWRTAPSVTAGTATVPTTRMTLDASGNVIINNTSVLATAKVTVKAGAAATGLYALAETTGYVAVYGAHSSNSSGGYSAYFINSGSSTEIYAKNTAAWNYVSDERLKTDIKDLDSTARLLQVKPRDFLWKSQEESDDTVRRNLGFIAQEVLPIFPELVTTTPNGMYGVEYTGFIAPLIKAFQEQQALIENLTTRLSALENK